MNISIQLYAILEIKKTSFIEKKTPGYWISLKKKVRRGMLHLCFFINIILLIWSQHYSYYWLRITRLPYINLKKKLGFAWWADSVYPVGKTWNKLVVYHITLPQHKKLRMIITVNKQNWNFFLWRSDNFIAVLYRSVYDISKSYFVKS